MGNKPVTESYDSLFDMGEKDISSYDTSPM
ncbi:hypothetical protein R84B8_00206 [Treponema sp. R8-4-B8]